MMIPANMQSPSGLEAEFGAAKIVSLGGGVPGPKGEPFRYEDFTAEQLEALRGPVGQTPNLNIGTVTTLEAGSNATASIGGTAENPLLHLGIPKGADGAGGGAEQWELINVIEPTEEANALHISHDLNGQPFTLKKALLFGHYPKYTGDTDLPSNAFVSMNNLIFGASHSLIYSLLGKPSKTADSSFAYLVETRLTGLPHHERCIRTRAGCNAQCFGSDNLDTFEMYCRDSYGLAPNGITELGLGVSLVYAGCYFALYGVRA